MEAELRISKGSVFQMVGAATAKLLEQKCLCWSHCVLGSYR